MLHDFITTNRALIIERCKAKITTRPSPRPTDGEPTHGVPLFLDQLTDALIEAPRPNAAIVKSATKHARELLHGGFNIAQVVHDYGNICQTITELAVETDSPITAGEFRKLNLALDDAIAGAVTEYSRLRANEGAERIGRLSHELRTILHRALLAFDVITTGNVGARGATADVLGRSLAGLRTLIDRELAEVRLSAGLHHGTTFLVRDLLEDIEVSATMEARSCGLEFTLATEIPSEVAVRADREMIESVLGNLLENAFKFSKKGSPISLHADATRDRIFFEVHDKCGGLPPGRGEELVRPYDPQGPDRRPAGLGLAVCLQGARANGGVLSVVNHPGEGCVFTLELPRYRE